MKHISRSAFASLLMLVFAGGFSSASHALTIAQAVDADAYAPVWTTTGTGGAFVAQTLVSHDAVDAAQSPTLVVGKESYLQTTVTGPGVVKFWWKRSGDEADATAYVDAGLEAWVTDESHLNSYDDQLQNDTSSVFDWQEVALIIPNEGSQTVRIGMRQNVQGGTAVDRLWVDGFRFTPVSLTAPLFPDSPAAIGASDGTAVSMVSIAFPGTGVDVRWQKGGIDLSSPNISARYVGSYVITTIDVPSLAAGDAGSYRVVGALNGTDYFSRASNLSIMAYEDALDTTTTGWSSYAYKSGGSIASITTTNSHDGVDAVAISNSTAAPGDLRGRIPSAGTIRFWWKHSGQGKGTMARFIAWNEDSDHSQSIELKGGSDWKQEMLIVTESTGANIEWNLLPAGTNPTDDTLLIDQFSFTPLDQGVAIIVEHPESRVVDPGSTVTLNTVAGGAASITYVWKKNGTLLPGETQSSLTLANVTAANVGSYTCEATNSLATAVSNAAVVTLANIGAPADANDGDWTSSGNAPWKGQSVVKKVGVSSLASGKVPDLGKSTVSATLTGPGTLTFWQKVSSEQDFDFLRVYVDGVRVSQISGNVDWQSLSITLASGDHTVDWSYEKDSMDAMGSDTAWIDGVVFLGLPGAAPVIVQHPATLGAEAGAAVTMDVRATGGSLKFQWRRNNVNVPGQTLRTLSIPSFAAANAGVYTCVVSNTLGSVTSNAATLALITGAGTALDDVSRKWTSRGHAFWYSQTAVTHDGVDAMRSGSILDGQVSSLLGIFQGPATISFWRKVSSEAGHDAFRLYVDGALVSSISGEVGWEPYSTIIGSGTHEVMWSYEKDASGQAGADAAYVDGITFGPPFKIESQPQSLLVKAGSPASFQVSTSGLPTTYQWRKATASIVGATLPQLTILSTTIADGGLYSVLVGGVTASASASLAVVGDAVSQKLPMGVSAIFKLPTGGTGMTFQWRKGTSSLTDPVKYPGNNTASLTIRTLALGDSGDYFCDVTGHGTTIPMGPYNLYVLSKPTVVAPAQPPAIVSGPFSWQLGATEFPTRFSIVGLPSGLTYNTTTGLIYGIPNVSVTNLKLKVTAYNAAGNNPAVDVPLTIAAMPNGTSAVFNGLVAINNDVNQSLGGTINATVASTGTLSVVIRLGTLTYRYSDRVIAPVTGNPTVTMNIPRGGTLTPLVLALVFDGGASSMTGSASIGAASASIDARSNTWLNNADSYVGSYNSSVLLQSSFVENEPLRPRPRGAGWQQVAVVKAGTFSGSGRTSDGAAYTLSGVLWPDGRMPESVLLYANQGVLQGLGALSLGGVSPSFADNRVTGSLTWLKKGPSATTDKIHKAGFSAVSVDLDGSKWVKPVPVISPIVMGLTDKPDNASVVFTQAGITSASQYAQLPTLFRVTTTNVAQFPTAGSPANPCKLGMTITSSTGLFTGSFSLSDPNPSGGVAVLRSVSYAGILLSHRSKGYGYFLLSNMPQPAATPPVPEKDNSLSGLVTVLPH